MRQLNNLCYSAGKWTIWKQSNRLGDTARFAFTLAWHMIVLAVRRRLHGKKSSHPRTKFNLCCSSQRPTFLQTLAFIQSFQFVCCQRLNFTASKHLSCKSFLAILTTEKCEIPVSLPGSPVDSYLSLVVLLGCKLSH